MKFCKGRSVSFIGLMLCGTALASTASAQDAVPAEPSTDEIIVTARRFEENLQSVPVAITAFSQTALERRSIAGAFDLSKAVPGLTVNADSGSGALPSFAIRGRGQFFGAATGSVESYFADVPLSAPFQIPNLPPQFFDLQSVQVLKGPQGTLFGRNTTGGAVLFVPAPPSEEFGGYARVQGGNYSNFQAEAAVNIPISDMAALRIAGFHWQRQGYTRTVGGRTDANGVVLGSQRFDNQDVKQIRATLMLKLSEDLTNTTIFTYHTDKNRGSTQTIAYRAGGAFGFLSAVYPGALTDGPRVADLSTDLQRPASSTYAIINTTTIDISDSLTFKNIFGYIRARGYGNNPGDVDGSPLSLIDLVRPLRPLRNNQTTNEFQVQGKTLHDRLTYIVGGLIDLTRQPGSNSEINIITNTAAPFDVQFRQSNFTSKSLFANFTYKASDKFSISAGVRHSWDKISERSCGYIAPASPSDATACSNVVGLGFSAQTARFKGWSYNAGAEYHPTENTMIYGGYRHGYKRGGFNAKGIGLATFQPENVDDFYFGLKQDLAPLGVKGHFNIEGFYDLYNGAQRAYLSFANGALATVIVNAPKLTYRGFDADFAVEAAPWLDLSGAYTFVDSFYGTYPDLSCPTGFCDPGAVPVASLNNPGTLADNPPGLVSRHKVSATARFHTSLDDGGELAFAPSFSYQSRFYFGDNTVRQPNATAALFGVVNAGADGKGFAEGYSLVDLRFEWNKVLGSNVDLAANVNNVFDKVFKVGSAGLWMLGIDTVSFGPPRMVTVEAKVRF